MNHIHSLSDYIIPGYPYSRYDIFKEFSCFLKSFLGISYPRRLGIFVRFQWDEMFLGNTYAYIVPVKTSQDYLIVTGCTFRRIMFYSSCNDVLIVFSSRISSTRPPPNRLRFFVFSVFFSSTYLFFTTPIPSPRAVLIYCLNSQHTSRRFACEILTEFCRPPRVFKEGRVRCRDTFLRRVLHVLLTM